jgi:DNA-binding LytR/AlgR family response regulator
MKIVLVEDEARIARRIERVVRTFFGPQLTQLVVCSSLLQGVQALEAIAPDLLLLDLNLNGQDGFGLLESLGAGAFHTIIISAYPEKAITAFAYGVLDFVSKPFAEERLAQALARVAGPVAPRAGALQFLAVKTSGTIQLVNLRDLRYIKGAGIYSELHVQDGRKQLHDKSLDKLGQLLPDGFMRIHKSYIVSLAQVEKIFVQEGGRYQLRLKNGEVLPIGRTRYKSLVASLL